MASARALLLVGCGLVAALPGTAQSAAPAAKPPARCDSSVPYTSGTDGYNTFRIPAVLKARNGAVLAFAEGRKGGAGDAGDIDLVLKRSTDGGCTWGPLQVVQDSGPNTSGNPAPVLTPSGRLVLLSTYNGGTASEAAIMRGEVPADQSRRVFVQTSDDDGAGWSTPREITAQAKAADWRWYATGPGHAVRLRSGRLLVPANHSTAPTAGTTDTGVEAKYYGAHSLYSDDNGSTWQIGFTDDNPNGYVNSNESTAAELPDGRVYVNTREHNGTAPGNRADAYSRDGGRTLEAPFRPQGTLVGPVVQGSVLQVTGGPLLYSGPVDPAARAVLTLRVSRDGGATWQPAVALSGLPAAYSDLVQLDGVVGVLYETGNFGANETITFRRVPLTALR